MNKKILFITDFYYPKSYAGGVCLEKIVLEFKNRNNDIHVVCLGDRKKQDKCIDDIYIHFVEESLFLKYFDYKETNQNNTKRKLQLYTALLLHRISKFFFIRFYPLDSIKSVLRYYKKIKELQLEHKFDAIIATYWPFDGLLAGFLIKLKFKSDFAFGLYILDTLSNVGGSRWFSSEWLQKKGMKWEERIFPKADFILYMKSHYHHHKKEFYDNYRDYMRVVDIPLMSQYFIENENMYKNIITDRISWIYTGALGKGLREPDYVCEILIFLNTEYSDKINYMEFYSRGDCEVTLEKYVDLSDGKILRRGYVERVAIMEAISNANVLVSIGNNNSEMVPSKIFEYMSTGKKIIHFYYNKNDSSSIYLERYPNYLLIDMRESLSSNAVLINRFLIEQRDNIPFDCIKELFLENTPEYTVNIIEEFLDRGCKDV